MAAFLGGAPVTLNGTTWVAVVPAPASSKQRQILSLLAKNRDTVDHVFESRKVVGAGNYSYYESEVVAPGKVAQMISNCVVLAATNESFEMRMAEAMTTTNPDVDPAVFEVP